LFSSPIQKYFYRYSRSRKKADSFEGRDDSGVVSSRFVEKVGGGEEYSAFFSKKLDDVPKDETAAYMRLLDNCLAMGSEVRPHRTKGSVWEELYGKDEGDRCRILFVMNTVGAGRSTTLLWETKPPLPFSAEPRPWISEQETAATHLERNLQEIDSMCATGLIAARVQVLVCEPIPGVWTDWMDSMLPHCGGKADPMTKQAAKSNPKEEERASPVQVVVTANPKTADVCHDLKSGFMEQRMQDLVISPPYLTTKDVDVSKFDPTLKMTHPDLISSDDHDLYVAMKWSTLVTIRSINSFLQASADLAIAALSKDGQSNIEKDDDEDGVTVVLSSAPSSPYLIPSFVRVSYVSEENNKVNPVCA
jgi:hypothetical protein